MSKTHYHWQNLNECPHCGEVCGIAYKGRAWWMRYEKVDENGEPTGRSKDWNVEWHFFEKRNRAFTLGLSVGGGDSDSEIQLHVKVPFLFNLFLSCENYIPSQYKNGGEKEISLRWDFDSGSLSSLWWNLWTSTTEWSSRTPRWREGSFDFADFLFGREKYSEVVVGNHHGYLDFAEGRYVLDIQESIATWKRPRWPFVKKSRRFELKPDIPIPIPGKGENSWDCGEDATYSYSIHSETADEAIDALWDSINVHRSRYGGRDWKPKQKEEAR